jgi:hypothetical protein
MCSDWRTDVVQCMVSLDMRAFVSVGGRVAYEL